MSYQNWITIVKVYIVIVSTGIHLKVTAKLLMKQDILYKIRIDCKGSKPYYRCQKLYSILNAYKKYNPFFNIFSIHNYPAVKS